MLVVHHYLSVCVFFSQINGCDVQDRQEAVALLSNEDTKNMVLFVTRPEVQVSYQPLSQTMTSLGASFHGTGAIVISLESSGVKFPMNAQTDCNHASEFSREQSLALTGQ